MNQEHDPMLGRLLSSQFKVTRLLGRGGFGSVYEAYQPSLSRKVAIKVLHVNLAQDPDMVARFRREALISSQLTHPCVVKSFALGETEDGYLWIAMEFVEGKTIEQLLGEQRFFTPAELFALFSPLFEALQEAHQLSIYHRDLKTENIMIVEDALGRKLPRLLDFGLASLKGSDKITQSTTISGTPTYMPPEQWESLAKTDARSDIYSLGVILYRCLSGKLPFIADSTLSWMRQHTHATPMPLESAVAEVQPLSSQLCQVVMRALSKDPLSRPQSVIDLTRALQQELEQSAAPALDSFLPPKPTKIRFHMPSTNETARAILERVNGELWVVGDAGRILLRKNPQSNWDMIECPVTSRLRCITESDRGVFISGDEGVLLLYQDHSRWERLSLDTGAALHGLWSDSRGRVFVVSESGELFRSYDFGCLWARSMISSGFLCANLLGFEEDGHLHLYAVGNNGSIFYSSDEGTSWQKQESGVQTFLLSIDGYSRSSLSAVGLQGVLLRSTDGERWSRVESNTTISLHCVREQRDGATIVAAGERGALLFSKDRGNTWTLLHVLEKALTGLTFARDGLLAIGQSNIVLFAPEVGAPLSMIFYGSFPKLFAASLGAPFLAAGEMGFFGRVVNRNEWSIFFWPQAKSVHSIWRSSSGGIFMVGERGFMASSQDNGATWSQNETPFAASLYTVYGVGGELYIIGEAGTLLRSIDHGRSWQARSTKTSSVLINMWGDASVLLLVGAGGIILRSTDQGSSWSRCACPVSEDLQSIWGSDEQIFIVGNQGTILHSRDNGLTWNQRVSNTRENLYGIWGSDVHNLFIAGAVGVLLHSYDQGWTWRRWPTDTISSLVHPRQDNEGNVWVFGFDGTVLCYPAPTLPSRVASNEDLSDPNAKTVASI